MFLLDSISVRLKALRVSKTTEQKINLATEKKTRMSSRSKNGKVTRDLVPRHLAEAKKPIMTDLNARLCNLCNCNRAVMMNEVEDV